MPSKRGAAVPTYCYSWNLNSLCAQRASACAHAKHASPNSRKLPDQPTRKSLTSPGASCLLLDQPTRKSLSNRRHDYEPKRRRLSPGKRWARKSKTWNSMIVTLTGFEESRSIKPHLALRFSQGKACSARAPRQAPPRTGRGDFHM